MPLAMETFSSMEKLTKYTFRKAVLAHRNTDFMARVFLKEIKLKTGGRLLKMKLCVDTSE